MFLTAKKKILTWKVQNIVKKICIKFYLSCLVGVEVFMMYLSNLGGPTVEVIRFMSTELHQKTSLFNY